MSNRHKIPNVFDTEQLVRLFEEIDQPKVCMASFLAFSLGLRIMEVCMIQIANINFSAKQVKIVDSKYTLRKKTGYGKDRIVEIPDFAIEPMRKWIALIDGGKWMFPSDKSPDKHLRKKSLYEQYVKFLEKAGLRDIVSTSEVEMKIVNPVNGKKIKKVVTKNRYRYYFHTLRHSYATYLRTKGVPIETIQELMGHERIETTLVYAKISNAKRREAIDMAFRGSVRDQIIPRHEVQQAIQPMQDSNPLRMLQVQLVQGKVTEEEYRRKLALLQGTTPIQISQNYG